MNSDEARRAPLDHRGALQEQTIGPRSYRKALPQNTELTRYHVLTACLSLKHSAIRLKSNGAILFIVLGLRFRQRRRPRRQCGDGQRQA
jgi:hypothetical protein